MKRIEPYQHIAQALSELDNGGRFYNLFTKADDGIITKAEVAKVAGVFSQKQEMMLFLDLATQSLPATEKENLFSKTDQEVQALYLQYRPQHLLASEAAENGVVSSNAIITGVPQLVDAKKEFKGFILVPVAAGTVITMILVPIMDKYEVYEIRDQEGDETFLIAHARGQEKLPSKPLKIAGIIKELKPDKKETAPPKKFLEALYYVEL